MDKLTCSFDGCERTHYARAYCRTHYRRFMLHGTPAGLTRPTAEQRFWAKVDKTGDCWLWTSTKSPTGYGSFYFDGRGRWAHRIAWAMSNGPVPAGMVIDHVCHNRGCVRPDHLRLATIKQNQQYRKGADKNHATGGIRNVYRREIRSGTRWVVQVKNQYVGTYEDVETAQEAARRKRAELFDFPDF